MATIANQIGSTPTCMATIQNQYGPVDDYESRQQIFEIESEKIIQTAVNQMNQSDIASFPALFRDLLSTFAKERQRIAREAKTSHAHEFGIERVRDPAHAYTLFTGPYSKTNELAIQQLGSQMANMKRSVKEFQETTKKVEECIQERKFSFQIEILGPKEFEAYSKTISLEEAKVLKNEIFQEIPNATNFQIMQKMKEKQPVFYKNDKMNFYFRTIMEAFPKPTIDSVLRKVVSGNPANLKSDWILVTKRSEINGKMYATSQWLTWVYRNCRRDPVERMLDAEYRPSITVLHQDLFLINDAMKECEQIFSEIMKWDSKTATFTQLKNKVALLRYIFAEAMPYTRGSAAIAEWLEQAIYRAHGYTCTYHPNYPRESVDLVAISNLKYSDYLARYQQLVDCKPLD